MDSGIQFPETEAQMTEIKGSNRVMGQGEQPKCNSFNQKGLQQRNSVKLSSANLTIPRISTARIAEGISGKKNI